MLGVGLVVGLGALIVPSLAWAGGTWAYSSADHTQLQINFQTDNGQNAFFEVFTLSVPVVGATCPGGGAGSVGQPDNNPDEFECQISPVASSGTVTVTTDPEQCTAQITNKASFNNSTYSSQNPIMAVANNCVVSPIASFTVSPSSPTVGSSVSFDGTASRDPNPGGSITGYSWSFGDGSGPGSGATVSHTYARPGSYSVTLTVSDAEGDTASTTHPVTVTAGNSPVNTGLPQISGDALTGDTLTASTGTWTNNPTSFAYQWQDCKGESSLCVDIPFMDSAGSSYVPKVNDLEESLRVVVTATNASGSTSASSRPTAVVESPPLTVGSTSTNGSVLTLPVGCSASVAEINGNCLLLLLLAALGGGQPTTVHAPDLAIATSCHPTNHHHCPKVTVVGNMKVKIPAGHTKKVRIMLNRAGRQLLAKQHTLKVKLTITENGHTLFTRTIVFKTKPPKKHR